MLPNRRIIVSAVVAALPVVMNFGFAATAKAQYQVGTGGHALDASNQIGSGGYNGRAASHNGSSNLQNNIFFGNVSGLNYFHGGTRGEFDSNTFAGSTGSSSFDNFNAVAAPVNYAKPNNGQPNYTTYYNTGNYVNTASQNPDSQHLVTNSNGTGFIAAPVINPLTPTGYDSRQDLTNVDPTKGNLLNQGELNVGGPVDPSSGTQSLYSMSPLYGVKTGDSSAADSFFTSKVTNLRSNDAAGRPKLTPAQLEQMRDELKATVIPADQSNQPNQPGQTPQPDQTGQPGQPGAQNGTIPNPVTPGATELGSSQTLTNPKPINNSLTASQELAPKAISPTALNNGLESGQGLQNTLLIPANKQSKQLAALEQKYRDKQKHSDLEATQEFNETQRLLKASEDAKKGVKPLGPGDFRAPKPGDQTATAVPAKPQAKPILTKPQESPNDKPFIITSLAADISAKGLATLMKTAEDQMRQGKFTEAVDTYSTAEEVAPNNPFVSLGRGFAELGASYYGKADIDMSRAINSDPAILVGKYDLKGFLGEDRLRFVHDDLSDIADHEKGARPVVLLAYIAHNNGDDELAKKDLDEAARRGGYANLIKLMRDAWNIK